jgi:hypothetical protein
MVGLDLTKGNKMYSAEITYVHNGIEYRQTIEDEFSTFYARVCGAIEGITRGGAQITFLSTMSDPYAKVSA